MTVDVRAPLTRGRMRADLAQALRLDPEEIGGEDDLADLGLDSMRTMALLARWAGQGARLDLAAVAEKLTLDAWWALAERALSRHPDA